MTQGAVTIDTSHDPCHSQTACSDIIWVNYLQRIRWQRAFDWFMWSDAAEKRAEEFTEWLQHAVHVKTRVVRSFTRNESRLIIHRRLDSIRTVSLRLCDICLRRHLCVLQVLDGFWNFTLVAFEVAARSLSMLFNQLRITNTPPESGRKHSNFFASPRKRSLEVECEKNSASTTKL